MKNLLTLLGSSAIALSASTTLATSLNFNNQTTVLDNNIKQIAKISTNLDKTQEKLLVPSNDQGINKYQFYWFVAYLWISSDNVKNVANKVPAGAGAIAAVLSAVIPGVGGVVAGVIGALFAAQWALWDISSYDQGKGIKIDFAGPGAFPAFITGVHSQ